MQHKNISVPKELAVSRWMSASSFRILFPTPVGRSCCFQQDDPCSHLTSSHTAQQTSVIYSPGSRCGDSQCHTALSGVPVPTPRVGLSIGGAPACGCIHPGMLAHEFCLEAARCSTQT